MSLTPQHFSLSWGRVWEGALLAALLSFPHHRRPLLSSSGPLFCSIPGCETNRRWRVKVKLPSWFGTAQTHCPDTPPWASLPRQPHPQRPSRAEPRSILLLFCESQVIIICIESDCLNCSGLIGTNTQKCALPVISDSLANAFCKIALDFNNRLLVLECRAHFISNSPRSPLSLASPASAGSLAGVSGWEILVWGPAPSGKGVSVVSSVLALLNLSHPVPSDALGSQSWRLEARLPAFSSGFFSLLRSAPLDSAHALAISLPPPLLSPFPLAPRASLTQVLSLSGRRRLGIFEGLSVCLYLPPSAPRCLSNCFSLLVSVWFCACGRLVF